MAEKEEKIVIKKNIKKKTTSKPNVNSSNIKEENLESNDLQNELDENDIQEDDFNEERKVEEKEQDVKKSSNRNKKNNNRHKSSSSAKGSDLGSKTVNGAQGTNSAVKIAPKGNPMASTSVPGTSAAGATSGAGAVGSAGGAGAAGAAGGAGVAGAAGGAGVAGAAGGAGAAGAAGGAGAAAAGSGIGIPVLIILLILLVIIVISVAVNKSNAENEIKKAKEGKSSVKAAVESGQLPGTQEQIDNAMLYSDKYNSYIGFTTDQINYLYNYAIDENGASTERKSVINEYKTKYGTNYKNASGILTIDDNQEIYKHILNTEKYNFNNIKWVNYSHDQEGSKKIEKDDLYKDEELGLMYPNDVSTKRETFIEMTSPYLLSNSIPLGFLTAAATTDSNKEYRPSAQEIFDQMYGTGDNTSSENARNKATFAYEILKYAQSDITVDQYQLKHYTLNTYYLDYDSTTYNDSFKVSIYVGFSKDTLDKLGEQIASVINPYNAAIQGVSDFSTTSHENTVHTNTRLDENNKEDVMKESFVSDYSNYENVYYVSSAKAFDVIFNASYNYTKYSDENVSKRIESDSEYTTESQYYVIDNENYKVDLNSLKGNTISEIVSNYGGSAQIISQSTIADVLTTGEYKATFEIKCGDYVINDGKRYDIQRKWDDKVVPGSTSKRVFLEEEVYEFNSNSEGDKDKTTIPKETLSNHDDIEHYKELAGKSELNSIDILDSNPGIFLKYLSSNFRQSEYIGYGRGGTSYISSVGYDNVRTYLDEIAENKKLPFIYGVSLGYDVDTMSSSSGMTTGSQLLKEYLRALEGGGKLTEKDGKQYYTVLDVLGHPTVGYGLDLVAHPEWKQEIMTAMGVSSLNVGDLADAEICDKIEDDFRNAKVEKISSQYENLDLKQYQIHALVTRSYNVGNVDGYGNAHAQYYNAETDDQYEKIYEQYKDNPGAVSEISSKANKESLLYINYMSKPVTAQGVEGTVQGLVNRRTSEWILFSLGYYDKLQKFWTAGGDGNFGGISVIDSSGNVDPDACLELQSALQNEIFGGRLTRGGITVGNLYNPAAPTGAKNTDSNGYLTDAYRSFFATSLYYQCPWWSRGRANIYLHSVNPDKYNGQYIRDGLGDGRDLANGVAKAYGIPFYTDISQIRANSIISYVNGGQYGHTAFVEAVGNDYYVISHCGSGVAWHGISIVPKQQTVGSTTVVGFTCMDDLIEKEK